MQLSMDNRPASRGVTQLTYVGDSEAVDRALAPRFELAVGVAAICVALAERSGRTRSIAAAIGAFAIVRAWTRGALTV